MAETETMTDVTTEQAVTVDGGGDTAVTEQEGENKPDAANEEVAKLRAELAKQKEAINKATREAADYKRALRAKQSAEEIAAEEKKAEDEATRKEIDELRREVARARTIKTVMGKLGTDEEVSGKIAEYLFGAEDADAALTELQRAWAAREKAIRLEFGKIPAPGAGGTGNEDTAESRAIARARDIGKAKADATKSAQNALGAYMR